jgi:hypothetical protein
MRRFIVAVIIALLVLTVYLGFRDGPVLVERAANRRQVILGIAQLVYASSAVFTLFGLARRHFWTVGMAALWAAATVTAAAFVTVAWSDAGFWVAVSAAAGTAVVTGAVVWFLHDLSRTWPR